MPSPEAERAVPDLCEAVGLLDFVNTKQESLVTAEQLGMFVCSCVFNVSFVFGLLLPTCCFSPF